MSHNELFCPRCPGNPPASAAEWRCSVCGGPLHWNGPQQFRRSDIARAAGFIWRFAATLPSVSSHLSLGEVTTPVSSLRVGESTISVKLESLHSTGSFKDRGCALLVSGLAAEGVERLVEDSSGNAGASLAAYAARAGIPCTIYVPAAASSAKLVQAVAYGAEIVRISGSRAEVAQAAAEDHDPRNGIIYASHNWHPWFIAGVATWALELWEQRGYRAPTAIVAPAGSGSLILGAYAAFTMLKNAGEIAEMPRLYAAQPDACAPLVAAMEAGSSTVTPVTQGATIAEGASIANPVRGEEVLHALRSTNGGAIASSEAGIAAATLAASRQGIFIEPTSGLALAAARSLLERGTLTAQDDIVAVLTGSGLKSTAVIAEILKR